MKENKNVKSVAYRHQTFNIIGGQFNFYRFLFNKN
jgi:hypothetical protein